MQSIVNVNENSFFGFFYNDDKDNIQINGFLDNNGRLHTTKIFSDTKEISQFNETISKKPILNKKQLKIIGIKYLLQQKKEWPYILWFLKQSPLEVYTIYWNPKEKIAINTEIGYVVLGYYEDLDKLKKQLLILAKLKNNKSLRIFLKNKLETYENLNYFDITETNEILIKCTKKINTN
uniref:Uncharacterized protein n=1 Tax=Cyanoptyche gloeocystis TaxID=77922 RepID=A0A3G1IW54_9EUKA|nr:hypothetical protein [Cyanoptyche gloeocystis]